MSFSSLLVFSTLQILPNMSPINDFNTLFSQRHYSNKCFKFPMLELNKIKQQFYIPQKEMTTGFDCTPQ